MIPNGSRVTSSLWYRRDTATCPYKWPCDQTSSNFLCDTPSISPVDSALSTLCTSRSWVFSFPPPLCIHVREKKQLSRSNRGDSPSYQVLPLRRLRVFVELFGRNIRGCCVQKLEFFGLLLKTITETADLVPPLKMSAKSEEIEQENAVSYSQRSTNKSHLPRATNLCTKPACNAIREPRQCC